ncbi:hypothetical protein ABKN59_006411 [Abortiporus biennis]
MSFAHISISQSNPSFNTHNPSLVAPFIRSLVYNSSTTTPDAHTLQTRVVNATYHSISSSPSSKSTWGLITSDSPRSETSQASRSSYSDNSDTLRALSANQMEKGEEGKEDVNRSSPSASSSQGDMADNEMDAGTSSQPAEETAAPPPPKKKRTRTLTTPHQSAVLHALLAQSRFPTTAMREEVGRAIGLSARKVQIWFQNQRQKARRPKNQSGPPLTRPPQFGPFTNAPAASFTSESSGLTGPSMGMTVDVQRSSGFRLPPAGSPNALPPTSASSASGSEYYESQFSDAYTLRPGSSAQLSGPGVPGSSTEPGYGVRRESLSFLYSRQERRSSTFSDLLQSHAYSSRTGPAAQEPTESLRSPLQPLSRSRHQTEEEEFNITLPPLILDRPQSPSRRNRHSPSHRSHPYARYPPSTANPILPPLGNRRSSNVTSPTESPFAHEVPRIPPPFTLQPQPLWDDPAFSPFSRPGTSSRPGSSYDFAQSPTYLQPPTEYPPATGTSSEAGPSRRFSSTLPSAGLSEEITSSSRPRPSIPPIRTRFDTLRPAVPSPERSITGQSPLSGSPSRPHHANMNEKHDVSR